MVKQKVESKVENNVEKLNFNLSEDTIRFWCNFKKGELVKLTDVARSLGVDKQRIVGWSNKGAFPKPRSMAAESWRYISRTELVEWLSKYGVDTSKYEQRKQQFYSTRELAEETGTSIVNVLRYAQMGIITPLNKGDGNVGNTFKIDDVQTINAYRAESQAKEDTRKQQQKERLANPYKEYNKHLQERKYDVKESLPDNHPCSPVAKAKAVADEQAKVDAERKKQQEQNSI